MCFSFVFVHSARLTVTECLQHPWFNLFDDPESPLSSTTSSNDTESSNPTVEEDKETPSTLSNAKSIKLTEPTPSPPPTANNHIQFTRSSSQSDETSSTHDRTVRVGLSPDRRDMFKKNMDSLARKFSAGTEIVIIESATGKNNNGTSIGPGTNNACVATIVGASQRRATATHTMPAGEVFKCTPVFILGEEQQCSDSGSDTVSEISTDSSSDRSSIYSDDSLDFILYGKSQGRVSFPFVGTDVDRWDHAHHPKVWPRECNGVVSKALSRFTSPTNLSASKASGSTINKFIGTAATLTAGGVGKAGLEALRERGGNLVIIREPVRAGRYTRYSEVQCESVQARIRRFQVHDPS